MARNKSNPEHHNRTATPRSKGLLTDNLQYIIPLKSFGFVKNFSTLISHQLITPSKHPRSPIAFANAPRGSTNNAEIELFSSGTNILAFNFLYWCFGICSLTRFDFFISLARKQISPWPPWQSTMQGEERAQTNLKLICYHHSINLSFFNRESVIDFSKPFMNLGISILFKVCRLAAFVTALTHDPRHIHLCQGGFVTNNAYLTFRDLRQRRRRALTWNNLVSLSRSQVPETQETKLFSFLNPLAFEIWIFVFFAYCLVICLYASENLFFTPYRFSFRPFVQVSFTVWIVARFSEWSVAAKCNPTHSGLMENNFTLSNRWDVWLCDA